MDYRAVRDEKGYLVSMAKYWGTPQRVRMLVDGKAPSSIRDLRRDRVMRDGLLELKSLQATPFRVE